MTWIGAVAMYLVIARQPNSTMGRFDMGRPTAKGPKRLVADRLQSAITRHSPSPLKFLGAQRLLDMRRQVLPLLPRTPPPACLPFTTTNQEMHEALAANGDSGYADGTHGIERR